MDAENRVKVGPSCKSTAHKLGLADRGHSWVRLEAGLGLELIAGWEKLKGRGA